MENNGTPTPVNTYNQQIPQYAAPAKQPPRISQGLFIVVAIVAGCTFLGLMLSIGLSVYSNFRFNSITTELKNEITSSASEISALKEQSGAYKNEISSLSGKLDEVSAANADLTSKIQTLSGDVSSDESELAILDANNTQLWIASDMLTGSGVTDNFVTNYVLFCADNVVYLDVDTQPGYENNYSGSGKFSISASKLKTDVTEVVTTFKDVYDKSKSSGMVDFSSLKVYVTIHNYNIGTYESGALTLTN